MSIDLKQGQMDPTGSKRIPWRMGFVGPKWGQQRPHEFIRRQPAKPAASQPQPAASSSHRGYRWTSKVVSFTAYFCCRMWLAMERGIASTGYVVSGCVDSGNGASARALLQAAAEVELVVSASSAGVANALATTMASVLQSPVGMEQVRVGLVNAGLTGRLQPPANATPPWEL